MVWYMSQALSCVVTGQIVSDIPGQIVCRVDRALEDKFLAGNVLVPQHSLLVARPESAVDGFDRLAITIRQIEKPNGAAIPLSSKASDAYGAGGLSGDVNRHIPQKVFGILATAVLSVGVRIPAGNTDAFIPTLGQQTAAQAGQGLSQAGQAIVQKQFSRPDTITVTPGTIMLIYPDTNISFAKPAKVVK
jgi:type IV secretory pathway VirB10-like protein